ncbi:hypothetical protein MKX03_004659 [Papaver bracteatum]|nr:hypothetical protein MKX03_004659 [Papaver bracteatum]
MILTSPSEWMGLHTNLWLLTYFVVTSTVVSIFHLIKSASIRSQVASFLNTKVSSESYSLDANLCLLRLYQFEPELMSTQIAARILVKQMEEQLKMLIVLSHYLEFWDEAAKNHSIVEVVPGFEQAGQNYAIHAISSWCIKSQGRGQVIFLPRAEFNHPELKKSTSDGIPLENITKIFPILG